MAAAIHSSFTIGVEEATERGVFRASIRCARCGRPLLPAPGAYVLRLSVTPDGAAIRCVIVCPNGTHWSLASGADLAERVQLLCHSHGGEDQDAK